MKNVLAVGIMLILLVVSLSGCNEQQVNSNEDTTNDDINSDVTPKIISFLVTPSSIKEGNTAELQWEVSNADFVSIDNGIGYASLTGKRVVSPTFNTTYTLTAINGDKETYATAKIIVIAASSEEKLIGTWYISEVYEVSTRTVTYIFSSDKSYEVIITYQDNKESFNGTWKIVDNQLIVTIQAETLTGNYQFSNNDKTLTITDTISKISTVLTKQE